MSRPEMSYPDFCRVSYRFEQIQRHKTLNRDSLSHNRRYSR